MFLSLSRLDLGRARFEKPFDAARKAMLAGNHFDGAVR
jgi:hypothetical protein